MSITAFKFANETLVTVYLLQTLATNRYDSDNKYWTIVPPATLIPASRRLQKTYKMERSNLNWDNIYTYRTEADARAILDALSGNKRMQFRIVKLEPRVITP